MKKGIAAVLSAIMVLASMYVGLGTVIGVSAATNIDFTYVDFDGDSAKYYADNDDYHAYLAAKLVDSGDEHGKVVEFDQMSDFNGNRWPAAIAISSYDGTGRFEAKKGETYTLSFDYRNIKADDNLQIAAIFVDKSVPANGGGSVGTAQSQGRYAYVCWADKNQKNWATYTYTFTAPCDGTILLAPITWNNGWDIKNQQIQLDNIAIEKKVEADGSSIDIEYHYGYNNRVVTKKAYLGGSYPYAVRTGYIFEGWYVNEELTVPAPSTVRQSCTKVYAKWSVDNREPQTTQNSYDDSDMEFTSKEEESGTVFYLNQQGETIQDPTTKFALFGARINDTAFESNRVLSFTQASPYEWPWPTIAAIYDNKNKQAKFLPNAGSVYEIKLRYRVNKAADKKLFLQVLSVWGDISNPNGGYNSQNVYVKSLAEITDVTDGWVEANAIFTANNSSALCLTLVSESTAWGDTVSGLEIYVDDVTVTERLDAYAIYFETNGGENMSPIKCLAGAEMPVFNAPVREGYCFTGWYYDSECTRAFSSSVMPQEDLILYAGWASLDGMPQSLKTGFEESEYQKQVYTNDGTANPVSDASMTDSAVWHKNDPSEAYDGSGYIVFDDGDTVLTDSRSNKFMAISLYNPDGTPFCVTEGKRYKVSLAFRHSGSAVNDNAYFLFLITNQSPGIGVNYGNSKVLYETAAMGPDKHDTQTWGEFSTYAVASATGPVKLAMYGTTADQTLDVDNVKIELMSESECVKVEYFQQDQNKTPDSRYSCGVRYGAPGDLLIAGQSSHIDGYAFDGWRTEDGELYTSNRFPNSDLTLYASWRVADNAADAAPNPNEEVLLDFEDTDKAKAFYEDSANNYHPENGVFLTVNDPDNAHSGNNYFQFYQCGHWMDDYLRRFKLYDPDTAGNQVYLEPNSVYKVSFWLNIESVGAGNLYLCTFPDRNNMTEYEIQNENYITDTNSFENFGKWVLYENTVITGDDEDGDGIAATLGFTFYGGYLTAKLDDISIVKLKEVTVSFESNGGSDVNDITQLSYDYAIAPADPEREGYSFTGWYTDEKLTQRFNFKTELITKDIKLYAGWKAVEKDGSENISDKKEPIYNTVTEYETLEETVDVEVPDKELDEQITFADTDKVGKIDKQNTDTDVSGDSANSVWVITAIACGGTLAAAAAGTTVVVVRKRKKRN